VGLEAEGLPEDDERRIVELFAERELLYDAPAVRRLTGTSVERLDEAIKHGHVEPVTECGVVSFRWEDVAHLALERWTPRQIARTLQRAGFAHALPPLNHVRAITVELPEYQIRMLQYLAEQQGAEDGAPRSASDILEYELAAIASEYVAEMEARLPAFTLAAHFTASDRAISPANQATAAGISSGSASDRWSRASVASSN
jgi:hypothetical protein